MDILPYDPVWEAEVVSLSLKSWADVFPRLQAEALPFVYEAFYPQGWEHRQAADIAACLRDDAVKTWVATEGRRLVGFVSSRLHPEDQMGEIYVLAVAPDMRRQGIGQALMQTAEEALRDDGMKIVMVETGGDSGHAPARATYEACGYQRWPVARYVKEL